MAGVGGPIWSLPGARLRMPVGAKCDEHPEKDAVARIQGETDSFGHESIDMCDECLSAYENAPKSDECGVCDRCNGDQMPLSPVRYSDEGLCGPIYYVCDPCRIKIISLDEEE